MRVSDAAISQRDHPQNNQDNSQDSHSYLSWFASEVRKALVVSYGFLSTTVRRSTTTSPSAGLCTRSARSLAASFTSPPDLMGSTLDLIELAFRFQMLIAS